MPSEKVLNVEIPAEMAILQNLFQSIINQFRHEVPDFEQRFVLTVMRWSANPDAVLMTADASELTDEQREAFAQFEKMMTK